MPVKVRIRAPLLDAEQFFPETRGALPEDFQKIICTCRVGHPGTFHVHSGSNATLLKTGDWLVRLVDGSVSAIDRKVFPNQFEVQS